MNPFAASSSSGDDRAGQSTSAALVVAQSRIIFRNRVQGNEESAGEFAQVLRTLAMKCRFFKGKFPYGEERIICNQFIFGLRGKAIQDHLQKQDKRVVTLTKIISFAVAAEDFKNRRFGHQHPLFKEEIQLLLGPHLDHKDLLRMRSVSKECKRQADGELRRRQKQALKENRWSPSCRFNKMLLGSFALYFSSPGKVVKFMQEFEGDGGNANSCQGWPFFGEGVVDFDCGVTGVDDIINFLTNFGNQVIMLVWRNVTYATTLNDVKTMLSHTPNLRTLWIGWAGNKKKMHKMPGTNINSWPELPYLDSIQCWCDCTSAWMAHRLLLAYGSKLTDLNLNECLHMSMLILLFPSNPVLIRPLSKVESLPIEYHLSNMNQFEENTDWKLKRLSLAINTWHTLFEDYSTFGGLNSFVQGSDIVWSLISQSRGSLEEVYINLRKEHGHGWKDFIQLYLLPVFHNPAYKSLTCKRVKKLSIPCLFLMRADKAFEVICTKFPNLEHIQFTHWKAYPSDYYNYFVKHNKLTDAELEILLEPATNLFFEKVDKIPVTWNQLSEQFAAHLWSNLGSLQTITIVKGAADKEPMKVVYKQIRKSKDQGITTTTIG